MFSFIRKHELLDKDSQKKIVDAIQVAESHTSGEIRVYIESRCEYVNPVDRAHEIFQQLKMEETVAHNAILIYVALVDRQFALYGGSVIYEKAGGTDFWKNAARMLLGHLKKNELADGLANCILELGVALAERFPMDPSENKNELPDEIVFGK